MWDDHFCRSVIGAIGAMLTTFVSKPRQHLKEAFYSNTFCYRAFVFCQLFFSQNLHSLSMSFLMGARVRLVGLRNSTECNNQLGTVMHVDTEKAKVHMDSGRCVRAIHKCIVRVDEIVPLMNWGQSSADMFREHWNRQIAMRDPVFFHQSGNDVYKYLVHKAFHVVNNCKAPGQAGWAFRMAITPPRTFIVSMETSA